MKKVILGFFLLTSLQAFPQGSIMATIDYQYLEKLIELARTNYPRNKVLDIQEKSSKSMVGAARMSYLDFINVSYFYRPQDRTALNPENPFVVNGFQVGISLSPGLFFQKPFQVRQAKAQYEIAKLENQDYEKVLENEVKSRYYNYIQLLNELRIINQEAQDSKLLFERVRSQYELGEAELEDYNQRKTLATQSTLTVMRTEVEFLKARDALEEIIGIKLTDIDTAND